MGKRRSDVVISGVRSYRTSFKGEKYLYQQGDKWAIVAFKPMPDSPTAPPAASPSAR